MDTHIDHRDIFMLYSLTCAQVINVENFMVIHESCQEISI